MEKIDTEPGASEISDTIPMAEIAEGPELMKKVVALTGLPQDLVGRELDHILQKNGCSSENLTLDQLRDALLAYLETLSAEMGGDPTEDMQ